MARISKLFKMRLFAGVNMRLIMGIVLALFSFSVYANEVSMAEKFKVSLRSSFEFLKKNDINFFGNNSNIEKKIAIDDLIVVLEKISFKESIVIRKPLGAHRFSGFSDPSNKSITISVSDQMLEALYSPLALHEFFVMLPLGFGIHGADDVEYQLSLLVDAYINFSKNWQPSANQVSSLLRKNLILMLLRNAIDSHVRNSFNNPFRNIFRTVAANNKIFTPDGGSGVGNGGDTKDIYFKKSMLNEFLSYIASSDLPINANVTKFILNVINIKVRGAEVSQARFYVSDESDMLKYIILPPLGPEFTKAILGTKNFILAVWNKENNFGSLSHFLEKKCLSSKESFGVDGADRTIIEEDIWRSNGDRDSLPLLTERVYDDSLNLVERCK